MDSNQIYNAEMGVYHRPVSAFTADELAVLKCVNAMRGHCGAITSVMDARPQMTGSEIYRAIVGLIDKSAAHFLSVGYMRGGVEISDAGKAILATFGE